MLCEVCATAAAIEREACFLHAAAAVLRQVLPQVADQPQVSSRLACVLAAADQRATRQAGSQCTAGVDNTAHSTSPLASRLWLAACKCSRQVLVGPQAAADLYKRLSLCEGGIVNDTHELVMTACYSYFIRLNKRLLRTGKSEYCCTRLTMRLQDSHRVVIWNSAHCCCSMGAACCMS